MNTQNTKEKRNRVDMVTVMAVCLLFSPLSQARLTDGESLQAGDYLVQRAKQGQRPSEILSGMKVSQAILRDSETGEAICEVDVTTNPQAVPDFMEMTSRRESSSLRPCGGEELVELEQMALNFFLTQEGVQVAGVPLAVGTGKLVPAGYALGTGVTVLSRGVADDPTLPCCYWYCFFGYCWKLCCQDFLLSSDSSKD